jgi:hypothetical protein
MTDKEIVTFLQRLFEPTVSPGQAFDALFRLRQERVMWADVHRAVVAQGKIAQAIRLDENEEEFECPGCGVSRANRSYCINPSCPEHKPNPETERLSRPGDPKFKNPRLSFGQYKGKTLLEVAEINPSYLKWLANEHEALFWKEQAKMAQIFAEASAPHNRDTSDTGFFQ